ncbi:mechanosensitive ion channel family protein [Aliiruegeria sabulilitoris]|uniref:mechanosensitive ion channel family protein n=1 Tax=Aliiruegeria sabulilitoris TaxID=1510458 RepID=UPI00083241E9|nr:mechanosensitive ion channel domain-containing protein [Aliiruegeria sabulilitoris]NDR55580.1 mechanosensitive ion channel [Pseudoruegeria sp. M32A2M]
MDEQVIMNALLALGTAIGGIWLSGFVSKRILKLPEQNDKFDPMLARFIASVTRWAILVFAGIFVLGTFGIQTTSLAAAIGSVGIAIGLALQGTLGHLAAGVMLVVFRPFNLGQFIEVAGHSGTVKQITLFTTELATPDNVQIIIPNGDVWSSSIINYSAHDTRRVDLVFGVSYDSDLKKTEEILNGLIAADDRFKKDPEPFVKVTNLGDSSVDFTVRVWCDAPDYWDLKFQLTRQAKEAFDTAGIDIPFPTQLQINREV